VLLVHPAPPGVDGLQLGEGLGLEAAPRVVVVARGQRLNVVRLLQAGRPGSVARTGAAAAARDKQQGGEGQRGGSDGGGHPPHSFRCGTPQPTASSRMSALATLYSLT